MSYFKSIRFKLLLMTAGILFMVIVILVAAAIISSRMILTANNIKVSETIEKTICADVENWRKSTLTYAQVVVDKPSAELVAAINHAASKEVDTESNVKMLEDEDAARIVELTKDAFSFTGCDGMTFADMQGYALARVTAPTNYGQNIITSLAIADAIEGKHVSYVYPTLNNGFSITAGVPIYDGNTQIGVIFLSRRLDKTTTVEEIKLMTDCEIVILQDTSDGIVPVMATYTEDMDSIGRLTEDQQLLLKQGESITSDRSFNGNSAVWRYCPIAGRDGAIVGAILSIHSLESSNWVYFMWGGIFLALCIIMVPFYFKAIRGIAFPLVDLTSQARKLALGDTTDDVSQTRKDEIGLLQSAMQLLTKAMRNQSDVLEHVANGDLSAEYEPLSEQDSVGNSLVTMIDRNNEMLTSIRASSAQVSNCAKQISDGAQALAQGSTEQASAIQQLTNSIADISEKTKSNARMAEKAAELGNTIRGNAEKGSRQMDEMMIAVNDINEASGSINKVIKVIDDIAFQTNILALNAAVEAARAGQHGKGFAVVAEEVRNLAAKSAEAARDTGSLIENSIEKATFGVRIAAETAESLMGIVSGINESSQLVEEIAKSSEEQLLGITQINTGIDQVGYVIQQNSATAEQSAAASVEMSSQSAVLQELIAQFTLKESGTEVFVKQLPYSPLAS